MLRCLKSVQHRAHQGVHPDAVHLERHARDAPMDRVAEGGLLAEATGLIIQLSSPELKADLASALERSGLPADPDAVAGQARRSALKRCATGTTA